MQKFENSIMVFFISQSAIKGQAKHTNNTETSQQHQMK